MMLESRHSRLPTVKGERDGAVRVLRYFLALAQEEGTARAAELLHITQPTLSRHLMDLEEETVWRLFLWRGRKMTLCRRTAFESRICGVAAAPLFPADAARFRTH